MTRDDLLKYVELDLWSRFQGRLWKVVSVFLTVMTLGGVFGVPYYIRTEIDDRLKERAADFEARTREISAHAKLLAILSVRYNTALAELRGDTYKLIDALRDYERRNPSKTENHFNNPADELLALVSRDNFSQIVGDTRSSLSSSIFYVDEDDPRRDLLPPLIVTVENRGFSGAGGVFRQTHPIRNGSYRGAIADIKYRVLVLEALRRSIAYVEERLLSLGGASKLDERMESVRVQGLENEVFAAEFQNNMASLSGVFLTEEERGEFGECRRLYLLGYSVTLPSKDTDTSRPPSAPAKSAKLQ
jgi:hypothetical protein